MLKRGRIFQFFFLISALEGLFALAGVLYPDPGQIGHSLSRLAIAAGILLLVAVFTLLAITTWRSQAWLDRLVTWLEELLSPGTRLLAICASLAILAAVIWGLLVLWRIPTLHVYRWYAGVFAESRWATYEAVLVIFPRLTPALVWALALVIQAAAGLWLAFGEFLTRPGGFKWQTLYRVALVWMALLTTLFQWVVLVMQANVFTAIPGWYWSLEIKPFARREWIFLALLTASLLVAFWVLYRPGRWRSKLLSIFLLGITLQIGFGYLAGGGFESLRMKYAGSLHRSYALIASGEQPDPLSVIRDYEARYGLKMFPSTKPPGVVLTYSLMEALVDRIWPTSDAAGRFLALTTFIAYTFPFLAFVVVVVLFYFLRRYLAARQASLPPLLYLFLPNILLLPSFLDNALYPLLFMLGAWLMVVALERHSLVWSVLAGLYVYLATFQTFSMLPLLPFFGLLIGMDFWINAGARRWWPSIRAAAGLLAGFTLLFVVFRLAFNYDMIARYLTANRVVRNFDFVLRVDRPVQEDLATQTVNPGLRQRLEAAFLNNTELATATGFPVYFLFLSGVARTMWAFIRRRATWRHGVMASFILTFLALNIYGQMQGEAARLWMFWMPMVVMFAGLELKPLFKSQYKLVTLGVIVMQLITVYLTFHFQDFVV